MCKMFTNTLQTLLSTLWVMSECRDDKGAWHPWPFETISFIADGIDADIRDRNIGYRKHEV